MKRDRTIQLAAAAVALVSILAAGVMSAEVSASAGSNELVVAERAEDVDSPQVALGIAMGAFRGVFVNFLWIRANRLKDEGQYHEAIELARAITTLQPRFPRVWVFHAWNMAYNISVETQTPEERWQWVQAGIRLLRDEGIPANPTDLLLHKELGWIFLHKVGGITDESNRYYKQKVAEEWTYLLGDPPAIDPDDRSREAVTKRYADWLRVVAEAPSTLEDVYTRVPEAEELASELRRAGIEPKGFDLLRRYALLTAARRSPLEARIAAEFGERYEVMNELMDDERFASAWDALIAFARKRVLVDEYHMEPWRMVQYTERNGPIDWRHPAAHSLYWGTRGVEVAMTRWNAQNAQDFDMVNSDRIVMQSIQELYRSGEIYFNILAFNRGGTDYYLAVVNPYFLDTYGEFIESREKFLNPTDEEWDALTDEERQRNQELAGLWWAERGKRPYRTFAAGYENFLRDAVRFLYRRGQKDKARQYLDRLVTFRGQNLNDQQAKAEIANMTVEEFVRAELQDERILSGYVAVSEIVGALEGAFTSGLLAGDMEAFQLQFDYAREAHKFFMERQRRETHQSGGGVARNDVLNPDFTIVAGQVFAMLMSNMPVEQAELLYGNAPAGLQQRVYDALYVTFRDELNAQGELGGRDFNAVFPEPAGMEAYRAELQRRRQIGDAESIDVQRR